MTVRETASGVCVSGFRAAGIREGKTGVALICADAVCDAAAAFTRNSVKASPVLVTRRKVKNGLQAVVVNSGNANACVNGGVSDAERMCAEAAASLGIDAKHVAVASTGIIGRRLNLPEIAGLIKQTSKMLGSSPKKSLEAAKTIMTTDTRPKTCSVEYKGIEVGGIAKGAGMIAPNMATMLCFITTNAKLGQEKLANALTESVKKSFNMIVVDGDESTNDTVLLLANKRKECALADFRKALDYVTQRLAQQVAYDGEGATKRVEFSVAGARNDADASKAVRGALTSPLVKTALYGENPNWGRIVSKIGSLIPVDYRKVRITFSDGRDTYAFSIARNCDLARVAKIIKSNAIAITVDLKSGKGKARGWGCDMSEEYVRVNAEYN